ncbi:MAG TPA: hypothetical protein VLA12_11820, partial [Planctomycetaceae bacterium]|nr:hypothetical protein [Planctomycetaceae bacterium]
GRQLDILHTLDGRHIPGEFFPHLIKDYSAIKRFQVIQETADELSLKIIADDSWNASDEAHLRSTIESTTGDAMKLSILRVEEIPLTQAGKLQVVVNRFARTDQQTCPTN